MNLESGWLTAAPPCPGGSPAGEGIAIATLSPGVYLHPLIHSVPAVRCDPQQTKGESLLAVALFYSVSVEGKKTWSLLLGTWLVHSLAARWLSVFLHARARQNASLVRDEAKPIHTIGEGSTPKFYSAWGTQV
ncbi:hypothetical protein ACHQM5_021632 [Ranunculus cassubicifolius]